MFLFRTVITLGPERECFNSKLTSLKLPFAQNKLLNISNIFEICFSHLQRVRHQQALMAIMQGPSTISSQQSSSLAFRTSTTLLDHQVDAEGFCDGGTSRKKHVQDYLNQSNTVGQLGNAPLAILNTCSDQNSLGKANVAGLLPRHHKGITLDEYPPVWVPQTWSRRTIGSQYYSTDYLLGRLLFRSTKSLLQPVSTDDQLPSKLQEQKEQQTSCTVSPATWLSILGLNWGFHVNLARSSVKGWKFTVDAFRAVPDDSLIFEFCRVGNLDAVRTLLTKGQASVRDTDSSGKTALFVGRTS